MGMSTPYNFQARNTLTGEVCGHHHHTPAKASRCIDHLGWDASVCVVECFSDEREWRTDAKLSLHHRPPKALREEEYD